jgi:hemolysin activation/secretion protein
MRKHLSKALQAVVLIGLVVWALDGHVPGLNEPVAPDPAPVPMAEQVDNALEQVRQVGEDVQAQTEQLVESIQKKSVIAGKKLARMAEQVQQSGQDMVQAIPPLNEITLPELPEFLVSSSAIPEKPVLLAPPIVVEPAIVVENNPSPELPKVDQNGNSLPIEGQVLPPPAASVTTTEPLIDTTISPDVAPNPSPLSAKLAKNVPIEPAPAPAPAPKVAPAQAPEPKVAAVPVPAPKVAPAPAPAPAPATTPPPAPAKAEKPAAAEEPLTIVLKEIRFKGVKSFSNDSIQTMVAKFIGIPLRYDDLLDVATTIENFYKQNNYLARVTLAQQDVTEGVLTLDVMESILSKVKVEQPIQSLPSTQDLVLALLKRHSPAGKQFNAEGLDRGLSLANELPGASVSGSLHEGDDAGETELILKMYKNQSRRMELFLDNQGSRATGADRAMGNFSSTNPTDRGDLFSLSTIVTKGSEYLRGAYSLPIGLDGWRAGLNASAMDYEVIIGDQGVKGAVGKAFSQGLDFIYPIERSPKASSTLTVSAETKQFTNIMATGNVLSEYESQVLLAQLSGTENEFNKLSGLFNYNFVYSHGQIRLQEGSSYQATDSTGNQTEGVFNKLRVNLSYLEPLSNKTDVYLGYSSQFADKNLDSSEKFQLGGANGIRAYPTGEGSGSDGRMLNFELRHRFDNGVTLTGFYDWGHVDELHIPNDDNPTLKNSYDLKGFGVSAGYNFSNGVAVKGTWATREWNNPNPKIPSGTDQDGTRDRNRFWLQVAIPF